MSQVEQIIHKQYVEFAEKFKPEFGNLKHIDIAKSIVELNKLQKTYEAKIEATHDIKTIRDDVRKLKRQILHLFKSL